MSETWQAYAVCDKCGWGAKAPFGKIIHITVKYTCCPRCGNPLSRGNLWKDEFPGWHIETRRYVADGKLLDPRTWGKGHWERLTPDGRIEEI